MFRTIATTVAVLSISSFSCKARAEKAPDPSSDRSYDILVEAAMAAVGTIIFCSFCQHFRSKKVKSVTDKVCGEASASHVPDVAAEHVPDVTAVTEPKNVQKKANGKVVYTAETNVIASIASKGQLSELLQALDADYCRMEKRSFPSSDEALLESSATLHVTSAVRACVSQKRFREAIAVFDHCCDRVGSANAKLWSLLVYASSNSEEHVHRCGYFFQNLWRQGKPNSTDVVNVTTFFATTHDLLGFCAMLTKYVKRFGLLDNSSRNHAMTVCAKAGADKLFLELASDNWSEKKDVVTYNTLMKYYVEHGNAAACLETFCQMREANVKPSEISVGIVLNGCIQQGCDQNQVDLQHLYDLFLKSDLPMNRVNYTTYIKGLVRVGHFDKAVEVLQHMHQTPELSPDLVTYSTFVKGYAEKGDIAGALKWLEQMRSDGVAADHVVFGYVLQGCSMQAFDPSFVDDLLSKLMSLGFKPCTGSLSIMLKVYIKSCSWSKAFELIKSAASRFGIAPEPRIYLQLARACHKAGETHWVRLLYKTMKEDFGLRGESIDDSTRRSMTLYCKHHRAAKVQQAP